MKPGRVLVFPLRLCRNPNAGGCRGNAMLEAALMITMLLALLFAFIDFGLVLFIRASFQHAVREGRAVRHHLRHDERNGAGRLHQDRGAEQFARVPGRGFGQEQDFRPLLRSDQFSRRPTTTVLETWWKFRWKATPGAGLCRCYVRAGTISIGARSSDRMEGLPGGQLPPTR